MKTYCISDIHGHFENLERFVKTLKEDDRVFVLGDVIDKGKDSIKCLEYIMNDDRFLMLLGNHEYMMFNLLSEEPGSYLYNEYYDLWVNWNSGGDTLDQYNELTRYNQLQIYNFIKRLPLNIPNVKVNDKNFYLVHSCPKSDIQLRMEDLEYSENRIAEYVWDRVNPGDKLGTENKIVIGGHTFVQAHLGYDTKKIYPVHDGRDDINKASYIDIDGGLATPFESAKLIALCLDDLSYELY